MTKIIALIGLTTLLTSSLLAIPLSAQDAQIRASQTKIRQNREEIRLLRRKCLSEINLKQYKTIAARADAYVKRKVRAHIAAKHARIKYIQGRIEHWRRRKNTTNVNNYKAQLKIERQFLTHEYMNNIQVVFRDPGLFHPVNRKVKDWPAEIRKAKKMIAEHHRAKARIQQLENQIETLSSRIDERKAALDPRTYLNKNISEICKHGFHDNRKNQCAHFVSHVKEIQFGYTCDRQTSSRTRGGNIRVQEIFAACRSVGQWRHRPRSTNDCLIFVTEAANVDLANKRMANVRQKHIGIYKNGYVYHYSNSRNKVVKCTPAQFKAIYRGTNIQTFYGILR